ncbi:MAG: HAD family hydrolase [Solirubrobacteraceae bacterium]
MSSLARARTEAVVFDVGGVLLDWNPRHLYRKLFADEGEMERFLSEICTLDWHAAHDLGTPYRESLPRLAAEHPEHADLILAWGRRSEEMIAGPIPGTVEILRELRDRGVRCYALTNMEAETYPLRLERYEFMRWFEGTFVSGTEGIAKPDPEAFLRLLRRYDLMPERTLLVDDSNRNIHAARALGIRTLHFRSPEQLRERLEREGLLQPRD